jgi:hypothetical protein
MTPETYQDYQAKLHPTEPRAEPSNESLYYMLLLLLIPFIVSFQPWTAPKVIAPEPVTTTPMHSLTPETPDADISPHLQAVFGIIETQADYYGLDRKLGLSACREESHFNEFAISPAGARGLFQEMPEYQDEHVRKFLHWNPKYWRWWNAEDSAALGCAYLSAMVKQSGTWGGLCSFNCGPGRFHELRYGVRLPAETEEYARRVFAGMERML